MKTLRFAALSLMLLLSAGVFAQYITIPRGDTLLIEFGTNASLNNYNIYPNETGCKHLRVDGNGSVTCFMGFKSITVNKGTVANKYEYTTDSVRIIVNRDAKFNNYNNISYGEITVNQNAVFYNDANISSCEININGENISLSFENSKDILSGKITVNGGGFENLNNANIGADVSVTAGAFVNVMGTISGNIELNGGEFVSNSYYTPGVNGIKSDSILLTGGKFANYETIESSTTITVKGGKFLNYKEEKNNDGGLTANIIVDSGRFDNGSDSISTVYTVTGNITVKSGEFHNWGKISSKITLNGGEFVNETSGKMPIKNKSQKLTINGGKFTNNGSMTGIKYENNKSCLININGGEFLNNAGATINDHPFQLWGGSLVNHGMIVPDTLQTIITTITTDTATLTNYGTIGGKDGKIWINSKCINEQGGTIKFASISNGEFVNNGNVTDSIHIMGGTFTNNGTVTKVDMYDIGNSTFTNDTNGTVTGPISMNVGGVFTNKGTINGYRIDAEGGKFINHGTITKESGYLVIRFRGECELVNDTSGVIKNAAMDFLRGSHIINKGRMIQNTDIGNPVVNVETQSVFTNYGTLSTVVNCKTGGTFIWGEGASSDKNIGFDSSSTFILKSGIVLDYLNPQILNFSYKPRVIIEESAELKNYFRELILRKKIEAGRWNFMGLGMNTDLQAFSGVATEDNAMYALAYNYTTNNWDNNYLYINTASIPRGEGILVYAEKETVVDFADSLRRRTDSVITVSKENTITQRTDEGNWLAMANPYASPIAVSTITSQLPQGKCVYLYDGTTWTTIGSGDETTRKINQYEGFFVNIATDSTKEIKLWNPNFKGYNPAEEEEHKDDEEEEYEEELEGDPTGFDGDLFVCSFLTVSVSTDGYKVPVSFAQNDAAMAGYDIFDANKLFGNGTVAEPYLVCNGVNLCKEEVNEASYAATMNIRSSEARSVEIAADIVPEGYSLVLKDGETETPMNQGDIYTTDIASGENAERFKLLINKNNVSLDELAATEKPRVSSINRNIIIEGGERVRTEVFNTLGQKVYETTKRNFTLNDLEAGAYVLRVQSTSGMQSSKIVIR